VKVRDIMSTDVTTLAPTDSLAVAEELMNVERVRHLPVVDGDVLVGLVSRRDLLGASISTLQNPSEDEDLERKRHASVAEIMRGSLDTLGPDDDAVMAADRILAEKLGCLPVIDERHHLLGIVTEADFVWVARQLIAQGDVQPRPPRAPRPEGRPPLPAARGSRAGSSRAGRSARRKRGVQGTDRKASAPKKRL
jgi:CBS domain-containing membrane protein